MKKIAAILLVLLLPAVGQAEEFRYSWVEVEYGWIKFIDPDTTIAHGPGIAVQAAVTPNIYVGAGYSTATADNVLGTTIDMTVSGYGIGAGFHTPLSSRVDLDISGRLSRAKAEVTGFPDETDNYQGVTVGVRAWAVPGVEVDAELDYSRSGGSGDTDPGVGTVISLGGPGAISLFYSWDWDWDTHVYEASFRYYF